MLELKYYSNYIMFIRLLFFLILCGCNSHQEYMRINDAINKDAKYIKENILLAESGNPLIKKPSVVNVSIKKSILDKKKFFYGNNIPIKLIINKLLADINLNVIYEDPILTDSDLSDSSNEDNDSLEESFENKKLVVNFNGSIKESLDYIAKVTGWSYRIEEKFLIWSQLEERIFEIAYVPIKTSFSMGANADGKTTKQSSIGSIWDEINSIVAKELSPHGSMLLSKSMTFLTVKDFPNNVKKIAKKISIINKSLTKEVTIKFTVLAVKYKDESGFGIDWDVILYKINNKDKMNFRKVSAPGTSGTIMNFTFDKGNNANNIIKHLQDQSKVSILTEPVCVTLNNQISYLNILTEHSYVSSLSSKSSAVAGGGSTSTVDTKKATDGLTIAVVPKVLGENIFLQIDFMLNSLIRFDTVPVLGTTQVTLKTPILEKKSFNQRTIIPSGGTLVLAGFKKIQKSQANSKLFGSYFLGHHNSSENVDEIIFLITPIITKK